ncbi:LamG domain-containing protein [Actinoplanes sp. NPDC026619]|uniref:LamG domain-containing protein n=1 Tax=Actinoplanes sp. NPDC026619 TaxID=3155798 RepID=UPI0033D75CA9
MRLTRRRLLGSAAAAGAGALTAGTAVTSASAAQPLDRPFTALSAPHLIEAEQLVQYQRLLAAGHLSAGLAGLWSLGGDGADRSGGGHPATLGPGTSWTRWRAGGELSLDGTGYATTAAVLDTTVPFTVSAWVRLAALSTMSTAVSQDSPTTSRFLLQYDPALGWAFKVRSADESQKRSAVATTAAAPGIWAHLAGVSDGTKIYLYVNGVLEGTDDSLPAWAATRNLQIGQATWQGAAVNRWTGSIADVRAYGRALTAAEIALISGATARYNNFYLRGGTAQVSWGTPGEPTSWLSRARCSSFVSALLKHTYPAWATDTYFATHFADSSPEAADYRLGFAGDPGPHLRRIDRVADLLPGDLIAITYDNDPDNTGHIVLVREVKGIFTGNMNFTGETQYAVEVLDCTSDPHGVYDTGFYADYPDTRMVAAEGNFTGVGIGHMMFYASTATGLFSRYRWSVNSGSAYTHTVATRPIAAARVV